MDKNLMIPVTAAQRELVNGGADAAGLDMATWARPDPAASREEGISLQRIREKCVTWR